MDNQDEQELKNLEAQRLWLEMGKLYKREQELKNFRAQQFALEMVKLDKQRQELVSQNTATNAPPTGPEAEATRQETEPPTTPETPATEQATTEQKTRGIKLGTAARVTEFHRLVKGGYSHRQAKAQARCDPSTYYKWCKEVTGEDPIEPYR